MKLFPHLVTRERSLSGVNPHVVLEVSLADEALVTQEAGEGLLSRVDPDVVLQALLACEALGAVRAAEGFSPLCVCRCLFRSAFLKKTAAALQTAEVSLSAVDSDVAVEVDFESETLPH